MGCPHSADSNHQERSEEVTVQSGGAPCPLGQPHSGEKKCTVKKKGRKKAKNDSSGDLAITTDEFYDGLILE